MRIEHHKKIIIIKGGINPKPLTLPSTKISENTITISSLMLGSMDQPRMPKSIFKEIFSKIEGIEPDTLFDQIRRRNQISLIQVLREIEFLQGTIAELVRSACRDQLVAIGFHIGSREIPEEWTQTAT